MLVHKLFTLIWFLLLSLPMMAFDPDPVKVFYPEHVLLDKGQFDNEHVRFSEIPSEYLLPVQLALDYYPELKDCKIRFRRRNIHTTLQCVPSAGFLFRKKENRCYHINIDNKVSDENGLLLGDIPFNAQVGVIGHELGHIMDYSSRSALGVLLLGVKYLFPGKRRQTEHRVDRITIDHGLGNQLDDFARFVFQNEKISTKYLKYKRRYYYSPEKLEQLIDKNPLY